MFFETLENRSLFSVSLAAGVLTVTGTNVADSINVSKNSAGQVAVNDNGTTKTFAWANVSKIIVNALSGDDSVVSYDTMNKPLVIKGGEGNDYLRGGGGVDAINGDNGDDWIDGGALNDDMRGNAGLDTVSYADRSFGVTVTLDDVANDGKQVAGAKDNVHSDFERIYGTNSADNLSSNGNACYLYGYGGNDQLSLGTGNGYALGGDGADVVRGGSGAGINYLYGDNGDDTLYGYGNQNAMYGGAGNDTMTSYGTGTTWCYGGDGNDTAQGGNGMIAYGGNGNDTLYGSFWVTNGNWLYGEAGDDKLWAGSGINNELRGGDGNDELHCGGSTTDYAFGDNGNDKIWGSRTAGQSFLYGGPGNDQEFAGNGYSVLHGDEGDDILVTIGGTQIDVSYGGTGFDSFWADSESTEKTPDMDFAEAILGAGHRIGAFANGITRDRNGGHFGAPAGAGNLQDFSNRPLFGSNGPVQTDIHQGYVGDCYFLATLGATAKIDAIRIKQSVVELGDGTYAVQFWSGNTPVFERVDGLLATSYADTPYYAGLGHENSTWVAIMEKAFAHFRTGANTYASIESGWMSEVFTALHTTPTSKWSWGSGGELLNYINSELSAGKAVTVGTRATVTDGSSLIGGHAYIVQSVNYKVIHAGTITVSLPVSLTLRNPWGYDGAGSDSNTSDGFVIATIAQAFTSFSGVQSAFV